MVVLPEPVISIEDLTNHLHHVFPEMKVPGQRFTIEKLAPYRAMVRMDFHAAMLRPGGTISGPSMFYLSDIAMWVALLGAIGPIELAVTTNLNINFLRRPAPVDMQAEAKILKLGKRLAVMETALYSQGNDQMVAHASGTYSIPPREKPAISRG